MVLLATFADLKEYVREVLCARANLSAQTVLLDNALYRGGQPCGIEYTLLGPRTLRLSAIWEASKNRILFYDEQLVRFATVPVSGPDIAAIEARDRDAVLLKSSWRAK